MKSNNAKWKNYFKNGKEVIFCTASKKGLPNGIIVISRGFIDGQILIADCQMEKTIKNLRVNNNVCIIGGYYKIIGRAKIFSKGKYFAAVEKKSKNYKVRHAILIKPEKLIDLDEIKILNFEL
jgi:hypothetical protein